ncbi:Uncharacterized protein YpmB [Shouchella lonarensis]|uniref:Uncharacterized protein YpmB n=2 Tax=Shouchella lonarensis TaxID=1464122 RepID=A0A1G6HA99_9BACI|nr:Uncharacterized protein YpmB [Shouchella lonarensis]
MKGDKKQMKKVISLTATAVVIILVAVSIYVYQLIRAPIVEATERATAYVLDEKILEAVKDVDFYHGKDVYWVVRGSDKKGQDVYVWLQQKDDKLKKTTTLPVKEGISEQEAKQKVAAEKGVQQVDTIRLGYEDGQAVYEVTYSEESGAKTFMYVAFSDGNVLKSYSLK